MNPNRPDEATAAHTPGPGATTDPHQTRPAGTLPHVPAPPDEPPGETFPDLPDELRERYAPLRTLGKGGLGVVYLAFDTLLEREVALKQLKSDRGAEESAARFLREARVTGRLQHPGIVPLYEFHRLSDGRTFYTMKALTGELLRDRVRAYHENPAPRAFLELLRAFVDLCGALAFAHARGVVHRDLKGANVQVEESGAVVVMDWGEALLNGEPVAAERRGQPVGTPSYMPPEQAVGEDARQGPHSDVYGLGAILYELLTNRAPVEAVGRNWTEVRADVIAGRVKPPRAVAPAAPAALEAVCLKALRTNPDERYESAAALGEDVRRFLDDEPVTARRAPLAERAGRALRRNQGLVAAGLVGFAVLVLAAGTVAVLQYLNGIALAAETTRARTAETRATQGEADARAAEARATKSAEDATRAEGEAKRQAARAQEALRQSLTAIDEALVKLGDAQFRSQPGLQPIHAALLDRAAAGCDALLALAPNDPAVLAQIGTVRLHMAEVAAEIEGEAAAVKHLEAAIAFFDQRLATGFEAGLALDRGYAQFLRAVRLLRRGDRAAAGRAINTALDTHRALLKDPGVANDPARKARCEATLGRTYLQAARYELLAQPPGKPDKGPVLPPLQTGVDKLSSAFAAAPTPDNTFALAQGLLEAGFLARGVREHALARHSLSTARKVIENAPPALQAQLRTRQLLGNVFNISHLVEMEAGDPLKGADYLVEAVKVRAALVRENPATISYKADLASVVASLARHLRATKQLGKSAEHYQLAFDLFETVAAVNPDVKDYVNMRAQTGFVLADVLLADARWGEATRALARLQQYLASANDHVLVGAALAKAANGFGASGAKLTPADDRDRQRAARLAVECLREAKTRGDKRTIDDLRKLAPLDALRGAPGYDDLLKEWGAPKS